jgi:hypothetical protein
VSYAETRDVVIALIPLAAVVGVFIMIAVGTAYQSRVREMEIKERIALIEKGIVPPPELERPASRLRVRRHRAAQQFITIGVTVIGIGIAVGMIVAVAGQQARVGYGVGGAIVVFGLALVVNGLIVKRGPDFAVADESAFSSPAQPTHTEPRRDQGSL